MNVWVLTELEVQYEEPSIITMVEVFSSEQLAHDHLTELGYERYPNGSWMGSDMSRACWINRRTVDHPTDSSEKP